MAHKETPEVSDAINQLILQYGNEPWLFSAEQFKDDAGIRLLVKVIDAFYVEDVLPRRLGDVFVVVQRVEGDVVVTLEENPKA